MQKLQLKVFTERNEEQSNLLRDRVLEYNVTEVGTYGKDEPLLVGFYDEKNELAGGLLAFFSWGALYIDLLWVNEHYRHQKLGSKLLYEAEKYAIEKKALYIHVNTATFQAPDFYLKNGFAIFAKLPIFVEGHRDQYNYYLIKRLNEVM